MGSLDGHTPEVAIESPETLSDPVAEPVEPVLCPDRDDDEYDDAECGGSDCDDSDPEIHPGAPEICGDGIDQDCVAAPDPALIGTPLVYERHNSVHARKVDVEWTGSEFALTWDDGYFSSVAGETFTSVFLGRLGPGLEIRSEPEAVVRGIGSSLLPSLEWTGSEFALAFSYLPIYPMCEVHGEFDCSSFAYVWRLEPDGDFIADSQVTIQAGDAISIDPVLVWSGSTYGAFWMDGTDHGCRSYNDCAFGIYFGLRDHEGASIGPAVEVSTPMVPAAKSAEPVWTGSEFGLTWTESMPDGDDCWFARFGPDGSLIAREELSFCGVGALAWSQGRYGFVATDSSDGQNLVLLQYDPSSGSLGEAVPVSDSPEGSGLPAIAAIEEGFAVAWLDGQHGGCESIEGGFGCLCDVYMVILDAHGSYVSAGLRVSPESSYKSRPSISYSGSTLGIAWVENHLPEKHVFVALADLCID